jgi:hypothetical protein
LRKKKAATPGCRRELTQQWRPEPECRRTEGPGLTQDTIIEKLGKPGVSGE